MKETKDVSIGDFLRSVREAKDVTQRKVSKDSGLSGATINGIEMGKRQLNRRTLGCVEKGYCLNASQKVKLRELFLSGSAPDARQEELDILYRLLQLPKESRGRIIAATTAYES